MQILLLAGVALVAGFVDAIAGGGGLLTLPALMSVGLDVRLALGTNKGQSVFGALSALATYARGGKVDGRRALTSFVSAFLGSLAGVRLVLALDPKKLSPIVLVLLIAVAVFFAARGARRDRGKLDAARAPWGAAHPIAWALAIGFAMGAYDGFFGPGVGAFLIALYAAIFGDDLTRATANAKVTNFASNLGSFASFLLAGTIDFRFALPMAGGQIVGAMLGARVAMKGGERVVRAGVLVVVTALAARLFVRTLSG